MCSVLLLTATLNDCYSEVTACIVLAYSYWASFMDTSITPTKDTDYSCPYKSHRTYCSIIIMESISCYIMSLVIHSFGVDTQTHTHRHSWTEAILKNHAYTWFRPLQINFLFPVHRPHLFPVNAKNSIISMFFHYLWFFSYTLLEYNRPL